MSDRLLFARIAGFDVPVGTPVTFQGNEVGHVIMSREEGFCECAVNSETIHSLIRSGECKISLEVTRK